MAGDRNSYMPDFTHSVSCFFYSPPSLSCYSSSITSSVLSEPFSCRTLGAVRVPAHLPLHETERHLFAASSPPLVCFCLLSVFCSLSPRSLSPPMNCEVHDTADLLFLFDKRPPLALAIKVNEQRHKDPAHAISGQIVTLW